MDRETLIPAAAKPAPTPLPLIASQEPRHPAGASEISAEASGPDDIAELDETSDDLITIGPVRQKLYEALFNVQDKDYAIAAPKLEWVIQEDPSQLLAWQALGWAYWGMDRKNDALQLWERLRTLAPHEPLSYNCMAMAAAEVGETARASQLYRRSLELDPNQYDIRMAYYRTQVWQDNFAEAIPGFRDLLKLDPNRTDVRLNLARSLMTPNNYEEALEHWTVLCDQFPENVDYAVAHAQTLLALGDVEMASEEAHRMLELDPNNIKATTMLADIAEFSQQPAQAIAELRKLIDRTDDPIMKSQMLLRLATLLKDLNATNPKDYPLAMCIDVTRQAVDYNPRMVIVHLFLGEVLLADRQYVAAEAVFKKVLAEFNRDNLRAKDGLLEINLARGRLDEAEKYLENMTTRFNPADPYRYFNLARLEYARGNYVETLQMLDRLEEEGARGAVFMLLYHGLSDSEWTALTSARRLREHLNALKRAGFKFIAPDDIPAYFESRPPPPVSDAKPLLSRCWGWIRYNFTGANKPQPSALREFLPEKVASVTFDDALRSTFFFGTPIAEELDTQFGMFLPVCNVIPQYSMYAASWDELRRQLKTGCWVYGSHLLDAHLPASIDEEAFQVYRLPNQIWEPERNRLETLRTYLARVRREFKVSRETIIQNLGLDTNACRLVAYPYGEIGQETYSNVKNVDNLCATLLNEASMNYDVGFIQSHFGYALKGDNPLLYKRYEPDHRETGQDVVRHAYETHPSFLARRMRAEIAALQGKPNLAEQMLAELDRDGYPEQSLKELRTYVWNKLANEIEAPNKATAESKREMRLISLEHPFIGGELTAARDNVVIEEWHLSGRAGININPRLTVEGIGGIGNIKQTISFITPATIQTLQATTNRVITTSTINGSNSVSDSTVVTYAPLTLNTNLTYSEKFEADEEMAGLRLSYRIPGGSLVYGELRQRKFSAKPQTKWRETVTNINGTTITNIGPALFTDESEIVGALEYQCKPVLALDVAVRYEHDVMPSAHQIITYDSALLRGAWRIRDWWNFEGQGVYSFLSDTNTMLQVNLSTDWLISERQGVYVGMHYRFVTAEDDSIEYWTPYWQQRWYLTARAQRSYADYFTRVHAHLGWNKERLRPEKEEKNPTLEQPGWQPVVGLEASLRRNLFGHLEIYGQFAVNFLESYTEYRVETGLVYDFEGKK